MSDQFIGEIRIFGGTYEPEGWAFCDGRLLGIAQYSTVYSLLGTTYGGDGRTTFGLPDLRGRSAVHAGSNGQNSYELGQAGGVETVMLTVGEMPRHSHTAVGSDTASATSPSQARWGTQSALAYAGGTPNAPMASTALQSTGNGQTHYNMPPYVGVNFIIALQGVFPQRP